MNLAGGYRAQGNSYRIAIDWRVWASGCARAALLLCAFAAPHAARADGPDAPAILKRTAAAYQNLKSYRATITLQTVDGTNVAESHFTETGKGASFACADDDAAGLVRFSDGQSLLTLDRKTNEYTEGPVVTSSGLNPQSMIGQFAQIDQNVKDASVDGEELYGVNGSQVKVYVVEVARTAWPAASPAGAESVIYSIDENTLEVYKALTYTHGATQVALYSIEQRNQPVTGSGIVYGIPSSAKQVSSLPAETIAYKSMIGIEAPDFTLKDPSGKTYSLHDVRGRVLVIDFVASWCPTCLAQTPYIQQVFNLYPEKDLEVYGLDVGEDAKEVADLGFASAFSFPLLMGTEPGVTAKYFVDDYPTTYVIGRDGKIVFKATGTDNPGGFLAAVKAAVARKP
jgi:thiol-disulfide isomerase/thioredoxin/outer membrane lipoprotein-sorting protein